MVATYRGTADRLADWLEHNVPEGLAVFTLPEQRWRRMRTAKEHDAYQQAFSQVLRDLKAAPKCPAPAFHNVRFRGLPSVAAIEPVSRLMARRCAKQIVASYSGEKYYKWILLPRAPASPPIS